MNPHLILQIVINTDNLSERNYHIPPPIPILVDVLSSEDQGPHHVICIYSNESSTKLTKHYWQQQVEFIFDLYLYHIGY